MQPRWEYSSSRTGQGREKSGLPWSGTVQKGPGPDDDESAS
jgi:hypothetical protein